MIGSRLLFSGSGLGFRTKPLHAGFLGQDVLLVHDEAHLELAFQALVVAIEKEQERERERSSQMPWPNLRVMELTATSRGDRRDGQKEELFGLTDIEKKPPDVIPDPPTEPIHRVWQRQKAKKALYLHENEDEEKLADKIADLALKHKGSGRAVLVFALKVEDVEKILKKLAKDSTVQLTGTLRGLERDGLVKNPIFQRFLPESNRNKDVTPTPGTVYLVCTSAGNPVPLRFIRYAPFHGEKSVAQLKQDGAGE
jgi:CRISPR-associated endonuclease/helicase Cas3